MLNKKGLKQIKKLAEEFFEKMTFEVDCEFFQGEGETVVGEFKTKEPQVLIGEGGKTLMDIQGVLGRLTKKRIDENVRLDIDINQYKKNKTKHLKELVQDLANRVVLEREERVLFPMSSYERRIVHLELAKRGDVRTQSVGEGEERRLVIKPV